MTDKVLKTSEFGLNSRITLVKITKNHIGIVKNRKSRIIMKDGDKILESAKQIKKISPDTKVSLITNAPVCSKTAKYLLEKGIDIIHDTP